VLRADQLKVAPLPPLSFTLKDGECLTVEGPSGSGKTRLLRAIADLDPAAGFVFLNGVERREMSGPAWRRRVRFASAEPQWWTDTVRDAFDLGAGSAESRLSRMMVSLDLRPALLEKQVASLSTGERQRFALIRALFDEPSVVLLDEPVSALDRPAAALVAELVKFQLLAGRSVIVTAHDDNPVARLSANRLQLARPAGSIGSGRVS